MRLPYAPIVAVAVSLQGPVSVRGVHPAEHVVGLLAAVGAVEIVRVGRTGIDGRKRQLAFCLAVVQKQLRHFREHFALTPGPSPERRGELFLDDRSSGRA